MKIVVDVNLSSRWVAWLLPHGHESIHWCDVGDPRAKDREVMAWATDAGRIVLTNDLDFGAILAASGAN